MSVTRLYLVRHGRASAGWDTAVDPQLDELGRQQSGDVARQLAPFGPLRVVTSPLVRCQQTAQPLCEVWSATAEIRHEVAEIPSPEGVSISDRVEWLRLAMGGTWKSLGPRYTDFRDQLLDFVDHVDSDTVIFSHFVAINAIIGAASNDDRFVIYRLDNCSVTMIDRDHDGRLTLVQHGHEADTLIR